MLLSGKFILNVPIERVWDTLLHPETLASCVPGCEEITAIDDKNYEAIVQQKVGPIAVRFKLTTALVEISPPVRLKAVGKGEDLWKAGTLTHEAIVDLKAISDNEVELSYETNVRIVGRLAILGDRIMRAKAKQMEDEVTRALREKLSGRKEGPEGTPEMEVSVQEGGAKFFHRILAGIRGLVSIFRISKKEAVSGPSEQMTDREV